jgi:hypothetical protein
MCICYLIFQEFKVLINILYLIFLYNSSSNQTRFIKHCNNFFFNFFFHFISYFQNVISVSFYSLYY